MVRDNGVRGPTARGSRSGRPCRRSPSSTRQSSSIQVWGQLLVVSHHRSVLPGAVPGGLWVVPEHFERGEPMGGDAEAGVLQMTRGTTVWTDSPRKRLISTARTSMPGICVLRNVATRASGSGIRPRRTTSAADAPQGSWTHPPRSGPRRARRPFPATSQARLPGRGRPLSHALERLAKFFRDQGLHRMRRVLQHLSDDRPSHLRVRPTLHLDECRHGVLIDDQVIDGPQRAAAGSRRRTDAAAAARTSGSVARGTIPRALSTSRSAVLRNLSTTLRHRRWRFTEQCLLLWMSRVG